jgi:hypothetical protein
VSADTPCGEDHQVIVRVLVAAALLLAGCSQREESLARDPAFAPLVGLCLEFTDAGALLVLPEGGMAMAATSRSGDGHAQDWVDVAPGARVTIEAVDRVYAFDGSHLRIRGGLVLRDRHYSGVNVGRLFRQEWVTDVLDAWREGVDPPAIDGRRPPTVNGLVTVCSPPVGT